MACVKPDGSLAGSARSILETISGVSLNPEDIAKKTGLPFFRVRSGLRDMEEIGLVERSGPDEFTLTPKGERKLHPEAETAEKVPRGPSSGPILPGGRET